MKSLLLSLALSISLISFSQAPKKGYGTAGAMFASPYGTAFGGTVGAGSTIGKKFTLGGNIDALKFQDLSKIYTSVYADLRFYIIEGLFLSGQGGYSIYSDQEDSRFFGQNVKTKQTGGVYYGVGAGYAMKTKIAPYILVKAANYAYKTEVTGGLEPGEVKSNEFGVAISVGIKF